MSYYCLTDPIRNGDIVRAEGRKHYVYSFGPCCWVRTTVMMAYMNPASPLYRRYEAVDEKTAQEKVLQKARLLARLLPEAQALVKDHCAGARDADGAALTETLQAEAEHLPDLEQKLTALCAGLEQCGVSAEQLAAKGFTPRILQAAALLCSSQGTEEQRLAAIRANALARAVRMQKLEQERYVPVDAPAEQQERAARAQALYQYFALERREPPAVETAENEIFVPAWNVYESVCRQVLAGNKLPHSVSNPVLRKKDGKIYLAFFITLYKREHLAEKQFPRPSYWALADLSTGKIHRQISCAEEDFSAQSFDRLYSMQPETTGTERPDLKALYAQLDEIRSGWLHNNEIPGVLYQDYLQKILTLTPPDYRVFYRELSKV